MGRSPYNDSGKQIGGELIQYAEPHSRDTGFPVPLKHTLIKM